MGFPARQAGRQQLPPGAWARTQREVLALAPDDRFGYGDPRGSQELTLAGFIRGDAFDRHIRRMRGTYRRRRDELVQLVAAHPGGGRLAGIAAGLHGVLYLPGPDADAERLRSRAARSSIAVETLASYWRHPPDPCPQGLVIGFGTPAGHACRPALRALTRLL